MQDYPKALYRDGWNDLSACVVVLDAAEEAHARKEGYRMLNEPDEPAPKRGRKPKDAA